jgi:hypothetical protein
MKVYNVPVSITAALNANRNSAPLQLYNIFGFSIQVTWTGTPTGAFKLQVSSDPVDNPYAANSPPTHWTDMADSSQTISAAGDFMWNVSDVQFNWVRLVYTDASSGASAAIITNAVFNGKGI